MRKLKKFLLYLSGFILIILITGYFWLSVKWKENISDQRFEKFAQEIKNSPEFPEKLYPIFGKIYLYDESTFTWEMIFKRALNPNKYFGCGCMEANYPFETKTFNRISLAIKLDKAVGPKKCINFFLESSYYSNGKRGFSQASKFFFNKPIKDLNNREIASLILMTKAPTYFDYRKNPERVEKEVLRILNM